MERELHISVFDQGATIPPEYREAIFEPFVQIPDEAGSGLGIELAACRAIIQAHGGRIWVEEGPGDQSNAFRITLPTGSSS
jgi:two-component system sensor histidine kinase KdpD